LCQFQIVLEWYALISSAGYHCQSTAGRFDGFSATIFRHKTSRPTYMAKVVDERLFELMTFISVKHRLTIDAAAAPHIGRPIRYPACCLSIYHFLSSSLFRDSRGFSPSISSTASSLLDVLIHC
jgi:hypothetical protein